MRVMLIRSGLFFIIGLSISITCVLVMLLFRSITSTPSDLAIFYAAAAALRENRHANIYAYQTLASIHLSGCSLFPSSNTSQVTNSSYVYAPVFALLFEPLTYLPCGTVAHLWVIVNGAAWALGTVLMMPLAPSWKQYRLLTISSIAVLSACCIPFIFNILLGQINILIFLALVWLLRYAHRYPTISGIVLGLITIIKIMPALLILVYLVRGHRRLAITSFITIGLLGILTWLVVGTQSLMMYVQTMRQFGQYTAYLPQNDALGKVPLIGPILVLLVILLFLLGIGLMRRQQDDTLAILWSISTMLIIAPLVWFIYWIWILPACVIFARRTFFWQTIYLLCYIVLDIPIQTVQNIHMFAGLVLWSVIGILFISQHPVVIVFYKRLTLSTSRKLLRLS